MLIGKKLNVIFLKNQEIGYGITVICNTQRSDCIGQIYQQTTLAFVSVKLIL